MTNLILLFITLSLSFAAFVYIGDVNRRRHDNKSPENSARLEEIYQKMNRPGLKIEYIPRQISGQYVMVDVFLGDTWISCLEFKMIHLDRLDI